MWGGVVPVVPPMDAAVAAALGRMMHSRESSRRVEGWRGRMGVASTQGRKVGGRVAR